ncbi:MAG: hypothetical protein K0S77_2820 [Pseudomonas sp.]|nr:hypothetical protein [Pseudomonas sp.]
MRIAVGKVCQQDEAITRRAPARIGGGGLAMATVSNTYRQRPATSWQRPLISFSSFCTVLGETCKRAAISR